MSTAEGASSQALSSPWIYPHRDEGGAGERLRLLREAVQAHVPAHNGHDGHNGSVDADGVSGGSASVGARAGVAANGTERERGHAGGGRALGGARGVVPAAHADALALAALEGVWSIPSSAGGGGTEMAAVGLASTMVRLYTYTYTYTYTWTYTYTCTYNYTYEYTCAVGLASAML